MSSSLFRILKYLEAHSDDFSYHGSVQEIADALTLPISTVLETIHQMEASEDAKVYWFKHDFFILRLLPFANDGVWLV